MSVSEDAGTALAVKFAALLPHLDERQRRLAVAAEARSLGHGGIRLAARAAGMREATVSLGVTELESGQAPLGRVIAPVGAVNDCPTTPAWFRRCWHWSSPTSGVIRCRRCGGQRLNSHLAAELTARGHKVGPDVVADLLREQGFSLQGNVKTLEGTQSPDRDDQFNYLNEQVKTHQADNQPVVSVDTKKKELVGQYKNGGREMATER